MYRIISVFIYGGFDTIISNLPLIPSKKSLFTIFIFLHFCFSTFNFATSKASSLISLIVTKLFGKYMEIDIPIAPLPVHKSNISS